MIQKLNLLSIHYRYLSIMYRYLSIIIGGEVPLNQNVCRTEKCLESANHLASSINKSADPCENFYEYACGNFAEYTKDKHEKGEAFSFITETSGIYSNKVSALIKSKITESDPEAIKKAKTMYKTCTDTDAMDKKGLGPLRKVLETIGLSPTTPFTHYNKHFDWIDAAAKLKKILAKDFIFSIKVSPDPENRTVNYITIQRPENEMFFYSKIKKKLFNDESENLANEELGTKLVEGKFFAYVRAISEIMDKDSDVKNSTSYSELLKNSITMMSKMVIAGEEIHNEGAFSETGIPKRLTLKELQEKTDAIVQSSSGKPVLNWTKYLDLIFKDVENVKLETDNGTEKIILYNEDYFKNSIKFVARKKKYFELILWWNTFFEISEYTTNELRLLKNNFTGSSDKSMNRNCITEISSYMALALAYPFVNEQSEKNKNEVTEMIDRLKYTFEELVNVSTWMDNETKNNAIKKIKHMQRYISHPRWLSNATELDKKYKNFLVNDNDFLATLLNLNKVSVQMNLKKLRKTNDLQKTEYQANPLDVNAFYELVSNSITIPMGILQFPFYGHPLNVLNYGTLGTVLGHEITHGLDDKGRYHDSTGSVRRWWQNNTFSEYDKRAQCFIDSYDAVAVGFGIEVDGEITMDENIADNGGFRQALLAYKKYVEFNGPEPLLPGFENVTDEQLFTIAWANLWCEESTVSILYSDMNSGHCPAPARANGPLKNSKEFASAWKCKEGSPMNPVNKCKLW